MRGESFRECLLQLHLSGYNLILSVTPKSMCVKELKKNVVLELAEWAVFKAGMIPEKYIPALKK